MQADRASAPDWRDGAAYTPLLGADRSLFAWEWLRRSPAYRAVAEQAREAPAVGRGGEARAARPGAFGLVAFEPPHVGAPGARPVWRRDVHPHVLEVRATDSSGAAGDQFDLDRFSGIARLLADGAGEHLLLSDGLRCIRLDGPAGTFTARPACLACSISGLVSAGAPLLTLRRFLALCRTGHFSRMLHAREARARRWILMLRAWDALAAGAGQREIAQALLSRTAGEARWRSREPSIRSQAQRLVRSARQAAGGGYRALLR